MAVPSALEFPKNPFPEKSIRTISDLSRAAFIDSAEQFRAIYRSDCYTTNPTSIEIT
jgi:hypothetical protein